MAMVRPITVTRRALSLSETGIVMIGVFVGNKFDVIIRPEIILPHASRLSG